MDRMIDLYDNHGMTALHMAELLAHTSPEGANIVGMLILAGASDLPMRPCKVDGCHNKCREKPYSGDPGTRNEG